MRFNKLLGIACALFLTGLLMVSGARLPTVGSDSGSWGAVLNEFLEAEHAADGGHRNLTVDGNLEVRNGSYVFLVNSSTGRIGIGTANPAFPFVLNVSSGELPFVVSTGDVSLPTVTAGESIAKFHRQGNARFGISTSNVISSVAFGNETHYIRGEVGYDHAQQKMYFTTGDYPNTKMVITKRGNVGVGTTSPAEKFTVIGNASLGSSGSVFLDSTNGNAGIGTSSPYTIGAGGLTISKPGDTYLFLNTSTGSDTAIRMSTQRDGSSDVWDIRAGSGGGSPTNNLRFINNEGSIDSLTSSTDRMVLTPDGKVGIGTTSPSATLEVSGNITATGGNMTLGSSTDSTNLTMYSPDGSEWRCGPDNSGAWTCS